MKIGIIGLTGRMGRALLESSENFDNIEIGFAFYKNESSRKKILSLNSLFNSNITAISDIDSFTTSSDFIIDFSAPAISLIALKSACNHNKVFVSGTTGFSESQFNEFTQIAKANRTLWASNMSIGVNTLNILVEQAAKILESYDTEILEMHHRDKKDAPSGTAITLGKAVAKAREIEFNDFAKKSREGLSDKVRPDQEIGFATLRGGSVIGDHSAIFAGSNDTITLSHHAQDRSIFANGAIEAGLWCLNQEKGFYSISDMLKNKLLF